MARQRINDIELYYELTGDGDDTIVLVHGSWTDHLSWQFVVPALTITGRSEDVKVATFNGTPFVIGMIQGGQVEMDVGENLDWIAHGIADSHMRRLCGLEVPADPKIPLMIFDASNAETAGVPPEASKGYGDAYEAGFRELWMLE